MKIHILSEDHFNVLLPGFPSDNEIHNIGFNTGNSASSYFLLDVKN